jgi:hypothetical protein
MVEFAQTATDRRLCRLLAVALAGKGAFGRFRRVPADYPAERERWYRMREVALSERARERLGGLGIEPVERSRNG